MILTLGEAEGSVTGEKERKERTRKERVGEKKKKKKENQGNRKREREKVWPNKSEKEVPQCLSLPHR